MFSRDCQLWFREQLAGYDSKEALSSILDLGDNSDSFPIVELVLNIFVSWTNLKANLSYEPYDFLLIMFIVSVLDLRCSYIVISELDLFFFCGIFNQVYLLLCWLISWPPFFVLRPRFLLIAWFGFYLVLHWQFSVCLRMHEFGRIYLNKSHCRLVLKAGNCTG